MSAKVLEFYLDMSEVKRNLNRLNNQVMPAKIRAGLAAAGVQLMKDTIQGMPTTPIRRPNYPPNAMRQAGELRASGAVFVDGSKVRGAGGLGTDLATGRYQPQVYGGTPIPKFSHEACVVFNAPYAATQHESFPSKTEPTAGRYFMSTKLYQNATTYVTLIVEAIRL